MDYRKSVSLIVQAVAVAVVKCPVLLVVVAGSHVLPSIIYQRRLLFLRARPVPLIRRLSPR